MDIKKEEKGYVILTKKYLDGVSPQAFKQLPLNEFIEVIGIIQKV